MNLRERLLAAATLVLVSVMLTLTFMPSLVHSVGSLSIPNTIGAQAGPTVAASLFDANWTTIRDYVNAREVTIDALSSRPAAGTSGRWYCANDTNQVVTCYVDTGATWIQTSIASPTGVNLVRGLVGSPGATPATQYAVTAEVVQTRNPQTGVVTQARASSTLTNNAATAGPAANGRDRATAFSDGNRFIHLYYITGPGQALATLSSTCSTSNVGGGTCSIHGGPTLPTGYDAWAYIGAVQWSGAGFTPTDIRGTKSCYRFATDVLGNGGSATTLTAIPLASYIASNALGIQFNSVLDATTNLIGGASLSTTNAMGTAAYMTLVSESTGANQSPASSDSFWMPVVSQQVFYSVTAAGFNLKLRAQCGTYPNGGE